MTWIPLEPNYNENKWCPAIQYTYFRVQMRVISQVMLMNLICNMCLEITLVKLLLYLPRAGELTHWDRVTHICVSKLTIIGSDNGLLPGWRQAIIWTHSGILLFGPLGTNFSEILIGIQIFSFKKMHLKMSSAKSRPFCLGLNYPKSAMPIPGWGKG